MRHLKIEKNLNCSILLKIGEYIKLRGKILFNNCEIFSNEKDGNIIRFKYKDSGSYIVTLEKK